MNRSSGRRPDSRTPYCPPWSESAWRLGSSRLPNAWWTGVCGLRIRGWISTRRRPAGRSWPRRTGRTEDAAMPLRRGRGGLGRMGIGSSSAPMRCSASARCGDEDAAREAAAIFERLRRRPLRRARGVGARLASPSAAGVGAGRRRALLGLRQLGGREARRRGGRRARTPRSRRGRTRSCISRRTTIPATMTGARPGSSPGTASRSSVVIAASRSSCSSTDASANPMAVRPLGVVLVVAEVERRERRDRSRDADRVRGFERR